MANKPKLEINFDPSEVSEYAVPEEFLKTPQGGADIVAYVDMLARREAAGVSHETLGIPSDAVAVHTQLVIF